MKKQIYFLLSLLAFCFMAALSVVVVKNKSTSCETKQELPLAPMNDFLSPGMPNYILL